jgi:acyl-CoA thioesterase-1
MVASITDRSMKNVLLCGFVISCVSAFSAAERATPQDPEVAKQTAPTPQIPSTGFAGLDNYRASRIAMFTNDFGQLGRYRSANDTLAKGAQAKGRVVFFGDSITDIWKLDNYFAGRAYVNRGISGQTTPQMLVRFRQDVIDLSPKSVVILAGTNDIAGNTGPMRNEDIVANLATMADLATSHRIAAVVASILPVHNYTPRSQDFFAQRSVQRILDVNRLLKDYCTKNRIVYLDYFSAMVDEKGLLRGDLAEDGLHPNDAGFKIMASLAEAAIAKATAAR